MNYRPGDLILIKDLARQATVERVDRAGVKVSWIEPGDKPGSKGLRLSGRFSYKAIELVQKRASAKR